MGEIAKPAESNERGTAQQPEGSRPAAAVLHYFLQRSSRGCSTQAFPKAGWFSPPTTTRRRPKSSWPASIADGGTNHMSALIAALRLRPDVIFLLTDGEAKDDLSAERTKAHRPHQRRQSAKINVIQFAPEPRPSSSLVELASRTAVSMSLWMSQSYGDPRSRQTSVRITGRQSCRPKSRVRAKTGRPDAGGGSAEPPGGSDLDCQGQGSVSPR